MRPVRPRRAPATSVAQAAEPQASVAPTPRSQTLSVIGVARLDLGEGDVGLLGEQRMGLEARPDRRQRDRSDVFHKEDRVRIAHVDDARRSIVRPARQVDRDGARVGDFVRQRDVAPAEARRAHVDAIGPGAEPVAGDEPCGRLDRHRLQARLFARAGRRRSACRCRRPPLRCRRCCRCARKPAFAARLRVGQHHHLVEVEARARGGSPASPRASAWARRRAGRAPGSCCQRRSSARRGDLRESLGRWKCSSLLVAPSPAGGERVGVRGWVPGRRRLLTKPLILAFSPRAGRRDGPALTRSPVTVDHARAEPGQGPAKRVVVDLRGERRGRGAGERARAAGARGAALQLRKRALPEGDFRQCSASRDAR